MTKKECAIVMAHTGIFMLEGEDFQIFHEYIEKLTKQKAEREKLIPEVGKIVFNYANSNKSAKAAMSSEDYTAVAATLKTLLVEGGYVADATEAAEYLGETTGELTTPVSDWYKVKGGLFNDGETHND